MKVDTGKRHACRVRNRLRVHSGERLHVLEECADLAMLRLLPLPVVEAQACGTAVAASRRGALAETLGDCGVGFDVEDVDDFAGAIACLAEDAGQRAELARRGPERVAREFSWETVARRTLAVFEEAVAVRAG